MMIIGEAWGEQEELYEAPFVGPSGHLLRRALAFANVQMDDCYLTNVFNFRPPNDDIEHLCGVKADGIIGYDAYGKGKWVSSEYSEELIRLWQEVDTVNPNVIFALGATAVWALTNQMGIRKHRGFITKTFQPSSFIASPTRAYKVVPSWHPAVVLRQYSLFPVLMLDAVKAARHDAYPELPPQRGYLCVPETIQELINWYNVWIEPAEHVVCDIETENDTITEVGFAVSDERAICIPFLRRPNKNYWSTLEEERQAWDIIRLVCGTKKLVGQNFAYDMKWLWQKMGIRCPQFVDDTMLLHHSIQPEMEKGLGFLASVYTDRPTWKFMRRESKSGKKGD